MYKRINYKPEEMNTLITEVLNKNKESEELLFKWTYNFFEAMSYRLFKELKEEVLSDALDKTFRNLNNYDSSKALFKTYITTILKNSYYRYYRRRNRSPETLISNYDYTFTNIPEEVEEEESDDEILLIKRLNNLVMDNPKYNYLNLHYYQGMKYIEIAEYLDVPLHIVKNRIRREKAKLKRILK